MNGFMRPEQVKRIKEQYPAGTRICCDGMSDDPHPIEPGTLGTVRGVDDAGQVMMKWDNGRSLSLIPGLDSFHVVQPKTSQVQSESLQSVKNLVKLLSEKVDEMIEHLGTDIQDFDIDELLADEDIRYNIVGAVAEMLDSRPEVDIVQVNDIGVPYQNCITVTSAAMQEEMSETNEPAEAEEPEMSM